MVTESVPGRSRVVTAMLWSPGRGRPSPRLSIAGAIVCLVAVLGLAARCVAAGPVLVIGLAAAAPYLLLAAPLSAVLFTLARHWPGLVLALVPVVIGLAVQLPLFVAVPAPSHGIDLVVMTANIRFGGADAGSVVQAARDRRADVLMIEELTSAAAGRLNSAGITREFPYRLALPRDNAAGTGLWSRFPLHDAHAVPGLTYAAATAGITVGPHATPVQLVALHVAGPYPNTTDWDRDMARLPGILRRIAPAGRVLVGGDFNATPDVAQFRRLLIDGYGDAADEAGSGLTATFPANAWYPPLIAIDHVLTREAVATATRTVRVTGSDHRALVAVVRV
jgi:endonuclease/exonuclease/phosphatase (EEP) superfamily protein YafD